jgi:hypothetical protein
VVAIGVVFGVFCAAARGWTAMDTAGVAVGAEIAATCGSEPAKCETPDMPAYAAIAAAKPMSAGRRVLMQDTPHRYLLPCRDGAIVDRGGMAVHESVTAG